MNTENKKEIVYNGLLINGFIALLMWLLIMAGAIYSIVIGANAEDGLFIAGGVVLAILDFIGLIGFFTLEPNEAIVMIFFGNYKGTFTQHGFYWINPFVSRKRLTLRARNLDVEPIKVNDKEGNPILIGMVIVWKLKDT